MESPVQLTHEQHGFEPRGSTYTQIFFSQYANESSLPYDFLSNIFFSLLYCLTVTYNTCNIQNMHSLIVYVIVRASSHSRLLGVTFWGEPKVIHGFSTTLASTAPHHPPSCSRVSCVMQTSSQNSSKLTVYCRPGVFSDNVHYLIKFSKQPCK